MRERAARRVELDAFGEGERERLLNDILGERRIAPDAIEHERVQAVDVRFVQPRDRRAIAGRGRAKLRTRASEQPGEDGRDHGSSMMVGVIDRPGGVARSTNCRIRY